MELSRALELRMEYAGKDGVIRVDSNGYMCLNEMAQFFPDQDMSNWMKSPKTRDFISVVEVKTKYVESTEYTPPLVTRRGRNGGTWAVPIIAFEFATWLSPEFKYSVFTQYMEGTQRKTNWDIKRIMASNNYKFMTEAIKSHIDTSLSAPTGFEYSNEARMLNIIVFGSSEKEQRDTATEAQLDAIAFLEGYNAAYIDSGMSYDKRKNLLGTIYANKYIKQIGAN